LFSVYFVEFQCLTKKVVNNRGFANKKITNILAKIIKRRLHDQALPPFIVRNPLREFLIYKGRYFYKVNKSPFVKLKNKTNGNQKTTINN
tara:strand:+ start:1013 stop:1282 length:270 start_codon:yes stop_codon:yes gene_type:complete